MAYQNMFPVTYQPMYYPQQPQPVYFQQPQPVQQTGTGIIWVKGEEEAKNYLMAPNSKLALWDSDNQTIYVKSTDASGNASFDILDYTMRDSQQTPAVNTENFVTKDEFKEFSEKIKKQIAKVNNVNRRYLDEDEENG